MDFFEVVRRRRSIRRFTQQSVKEEDILAMLEAARLAPSATNEQPWRFIVVRDQEIKSQMQDMVNAIIDVRIESEEDEKGALPPELAQKMAEEVKAAAEMGDVMKIKSIAGELKTQSSAYTPIGDKLIQLADDFDFDGCLQFLEKLMG